MGARRCRHFSSRAGRRRADDAAGNRASRISVSRIFIYLDCDASADDARFSCYFLEASSAGPAAQRVKHTTTSSARKPIENDIWCHARKDDDVARMYWRVI